MCRGAASRLAGGRKSPVRVVSLAMIDRSDTSWVTTIAINVNDRLHHVNWTSSQLRNFLNSGFVTNTGAHRKFCKRFVVLSSVLHRPYIVGNASLGPNWQSPRRPLFQNPCVDVSGFAGRSPYFEIYCKERGEHKVHHSRILTPLLPTLPASVLP